MASAPDTPRWLTGPLPRPAVLALAAALCAATLFAFWPAAGAGLCLFDDTQFLIEASGWRKGNPDWLHWIFTTMVGGHYQPLTYLSYAMEERLFGTVPPSAADVCTPRDTTSQGYHVTNILLHTLNALLVYAVALRVLRTASRPQPGAAMPQATGAQHAASFLCALLWAINPLRVESVAWVTERRDVLSACFLLLATLGYLRWAADPRRAHARWYAAALLALVLSLLSKAWGMSFFAVALLLDIYPLRRLPLWPWRWFTRAAAPVLLEKLPHAALGVIFAYLAGKAQASAPFTVSSLSRWGMEQRTAQAFYGLVFYIRKTAWPTRLSALYELPATAHLTDARFLVPALLVVVGAALVIALARRRPGLAVAFAAYLVLIAPVLGLFQSGIQLVAERYAYLSIIPLFIAGALLLANGLATGRIHGHGRLLAWAGCLGLATLWCMMTWRQSHLWFNTRFLWEDALANGHDGVMLRTFYGNHLWNDKEVEAAEEQYQKALAIDRTYGDTWMGMAMIERERHNWTAARDDLLEAGKDPMVTLKSELLLGLMYMNEQQLNDPQQGLVHFTKSVASMESIGGRALVGRPYLHLGQAYGILGDDANALLYLKKAARFRDAKKEAEQCIRDITGG
ncbi:MAG: hypothetical protein U0637_03915 [Phycisphaerales bacterium]